MALSEAQKAELRKAGYSDATIAAISLNPGAFKSDSKIQNVVNGGGAAKDGFFSGLVGNITRAANSATAVAAPKSGVQSPYVSKSGSYDPKVQQARNAPSGSSSQRSSSGNYNPTTQAARNKTATNNGGVFGGLINTLSNIANTVADKAKNGGLSGGLSNAGGEPLFGGDFSGGMAAGGMGEGAYQPVEYQVPVFERRDFTDKANALSKDAFAPAFQAIAQAMSNADANYKKSDERVNSLYQNLVNNIASQAAKTQESYNQQAAQSQQATGNLQQAIADTYNNSGQQQADLLQQLGLNAAAGPNGGVLNQGASDSAYQQAQAQLQGAANTNAINQQGAAQGDYLSSLGLASQAEGNVSRRDLLDKLSSQLAGYDQQNLQLQSQQRTTGLDIANQLSDKDLELQRLNADAYTQGYNINNANAQQQTQFGQSQQQINNQASQFGADQAFRAQQARQDQFNNDRNYDLQSQQIRQDQATSLANLGLEQQKLDIAARGSGSSGSANMSDLDPYTKVNAQAATAVPNGQAKQYVNLIDNFVRSAATRGDNVNNYASNPIDFMLKISDEAARNGLNPDAAQSVAASYYQNILRKQSDQ